MSSQLTLFNELDKSTHNLCGRLRTANIPTTVNKTVNDTALVEIH